MLRRILFLLALVALSGCQLLPEGRDTPSARPAERPPVAPNTASRVCLSGLGATGARFTALPGRYYGAGCSTLGTVQLTGLQGDATGFELANIGPITCPLAEAMAGWARYGVDRAARQILGSGLARIETMGSYSCRNVAGSGRRSAHASAEAVDVGGFVLENGRRVTVLGGWQDPDPKVREFLRVIHRSACKRLGTVLGPDYNAAHANHFHLERTGDDFCR